MKAKLVKNSSDPYFFLIEKMEQITDAIGNPTALLIERIFWLGLGAFLGLAIITSLLRGLQEGKNKTTSVSPDQLENLAKKAIQQNCDSN